MGRYGTKIPVTIEIIRKEKWYVARAVELDFVSQGRTPEEAKKNLLEVIEIQFEEMAREGVLEDYLAECGYELSLHTSPELVAIEKTEFGFECRA